MKFMYMFGLFANYNETNLPCFNVGNIMCYSKKETSFGINDFPGNIP